MKGFVKDPNEAKRYLTLDGAPSPSIATKEDMDQVEVAEKPDRRRIDLTKNVKLKFSLETHYFSNCTTFLMFTFFCSVQEFNLTNERFLVPEMIFRPADLGLYLVNFHELVFGVFISI